MIQPADKKKSLWRNVVFLDAYREKKGLFDAHAIALKKKRGDF